jgi:hypothetical protein
VGDRVEAEENEDEAQDGDRGGRESVASVHVDQSPILCDKPWNVNALGVFKFCVGWVNSFLNPFPNRPSRRLQNSRV